MNILLPTDSFYERCYVRDPFCAHRMLDGLRAPRHQILILPAPQPTLKYQERFVLNERQRRANHR